MVVYYSGLTVETTPVYKRTLTGVIIICSCSGLQPLACTMQATRIGQILLVAFRMGRRMCRQSLMHIPVYPSA